jgi:hypothetical protein
MMQQIKITTQIGFRFRFNLIPCPGGAECKPSSVFSTPTPTPTPTPPPKPKPKLNSLH